MKERLRNFDPSLQILRDLADSYDLTYQRLTLVRQAISSPQSFRRLPSQAILVNVEKQFVDKANEIKALAMNCAALTREAKACENVSVAIPPMQPALERLPSCDTPDEQQKLNGCTRVALVGEACGCMSCEFQREARQILKSTPARYTCRGMPAGRRVDVSFDALLTQPLNKPKLWYLLDYSLKRSDGTVLAKREGVGASGAPSHNVGLALQSNVPPNGEIVVDVAVTLCQPDHHEDHDRCTVSPIANKPIWRINVTD
jgi:hypothetical protein